MSVYTRMLLLICTLTMACGQLFSDNRELSERDHEAVVEFLNSKRTLDLSEKKDYFKVSGSVRAKWLDRWENGIVLGNYVPLRGRHAVNRLGMRVNVPHDTYEAELHIKLRYDCKDISWAEGYLQFDNEAGVGHFSDCRLNPEGCFGSGECDDLCLKRAFFGWNVWRKGKFTKFDIEIGRRPLYLVFDSRIEFHARFDGILFNFEHSDEKWGEFFIQGTPFVVDFRKNHYAFVTEFGVIDFRKLHIDIMYSFADWTINNQSICGGLERGWQFRNSQISAGYYFFEPYFDKKVKAYGGFLVNHAAKKRLLTRNRYANIGWYLGVIMGEVKKKDDWSFDINYQYVEAQAVSDCDVHGIGRGNVLKETFNESGRGKANYKGWSMEGLYAATDKLNLDAQIEFSKPADSKIGGRHYYFKFEFALIHSY